MNLKLSKLVQLHWFQMENQTQCMCESHNSWSLVDVAACLLWHWTYLSSWFVIQLLLREQNTKNLCCENQTCDLTSIVCTVSVFTANVKVKKRKENERDHFKESIMRQFVCVCFVLCRRSSRWSSVWCCAAGSATARSTRGPDRRLPPPPQEGRARCNFLSPFLRLLSEAGTLPYICLLDVVGSLRKWCKGFSVWASESHF